MFNQSLTRFAIIWKSIIRETSVSYSDEQTGVEIKSNEFDVKAQEKLNSSESTQSLFKKLGLHKIISQEEKREQKVDINLIAQGPDSNTGFTVFEAKTFSKVLEITPESMISKPWYFMNRHNAFDVNCISLLYETPFVNLVFSDQPRECHQFYIDEQTVNNRNRWGAAHEYSGFTVGDKLVDSDQGKRCLKPTFIRTFKSEIKNIQ